MEVEECWENSIYFKIKLENDKNLGWRWERWWLLNGKLKNYWIRKRKRSDKVCVCREREKREEAIDCDGRIL